MIEITIGGSDFNFWSNVVVPLLSVVIGGGLTILGTRIQTKKEVEQAEKRRRWDIAKELSQVMTRLQTVIAKNSYSVINRNSYSEAELNELYHEGTQVFEDALTCLQGLRFALSERLAEAAQSFLDATEHNTRVWKERLQDKPSRKSSDYLPHKDQGSRGGKAYNAFVNLSNELEKYVGGKGSNQNQRAN